MRGPSPWSGNPAPSERPERYGNERKSYDDQRDSNEIGIDSRRIPEAHVDVLFVPLVARVQDQEQPDHSEKRSEEQAEESAHDLHDDDVRRGQAPVREGRARGRAASRIASSATLTGRRSHSGCGWSGALLGLALLFGRRFRFYAAGPKPIHEDY